jgi:hypothetical protein
MNNSVKARSQEVLSMLQRSGVLLLLLFFLIPSLPVLSQSKNRSFATAADVRRDSSTRHLKHKSCGTWSSYVPDTLHPELTPFRRVRINIHVMLDGVGKNNFPDNAVGRQWIKDLVINANARLDKNTKMNLPHGNNTPVLRVPFHYVLTGEPGNPDDDGIYFHRDDSLFFMNKRARNQTSVYDNRQFQVYGARKDSVINVFLMEHHPDSVKSKTYRASNDGIGMGPWAKVVGCYNIWKTPTVMANGDTFRYSPWEAAALFNHELGHCLGLQHTWNTDDGCDDTPKNPGCWNFNEPPGCNDVSNNVMDYNAYKIAYSPCQLGRINKGFFDEKGTRKYLQPDWCAYEAAKTITIAAGTLAEWNSAVDVMGDLVVENNATLVLRCHTSLPPGGKVILNAKATLILDGGALTSRCALPFEGIEINRTKKASPEIYLKNGASIENALHPIQ